MTDIDIIIEAAKRTGDAINRSVWISEGERKFLSNAFLAFADDVLKVAGEAKEAELARALDNLEEAVSSQDGGK